MRAVILLALFAAVALAQYRPLTAEDFAPMVEGQSESFVPRVFQDYDNDGDDDVVPMVFDEDDDEDDVFVPFVQDDEDDDEDDEDLVPFVMQSYNIPNQALELIKEFEGFYPNAYADAIHGWAVPTIGYGTTVYPDGRKVRRGETCTKAQATEWLKAYTQKAVVSKLLKIPTWNKMNANQQSAVISFAYNLGEHFYGNPDFKSITSLLSDPSRWNDANDVLTQFYKYRNPGSSAEVGLARRRKAEAALFSAGGSSVAAPSNSGGECSSSCKSCISTGGGAGCVSKCSGCASTCISCVKYGGGKGCAAKC